MLAIFAVTFPFFALVLCGYAATRRGLLPLLAIPGLNSFVLFFALPCMLYRFGARTPIAQLLNPSLVAVYALCALMMVGLTVMLTRRGRIGWNDASFGALVAAFPNTWFMGVPLLVALLGAQAAGPAIVTIAIDMVITSSLCIALSQLDGARVRKAQAGPHGGRWPAWWPTRCPCRLRLARWLPASRSHCRCRLIQPSTCWQTRRRPRPCSRLARCWYAPK